LKIAEFRYNFLLLASELYRRKSGHRDPRKNFPAGQRSGRRDIDTSRSLSRTNVLVTSRQIS